MGEGAEEGDVEGERGSKKIEECVALWLVSREERERERGERRTPEL